LNSYPEALAQRIIIMLIAPVSMRFIYIFNIYNCVIHIIIIYMHIYIIHTCISHPIHVPILIEKIRLILKSIHTSSLRPQAVQTAVTVRTNQCALLAETATGLCVHIRQLLNLLNHVHCHIKYLIFN